MQVSTGHGGMYIVMLAIDVITVLVNSIARIVDISAPVIAATPGGSPTLQDMPLAPSATHMGALPSPSFSEPAVSALVKAGVAAFTPRASSESAQFSCTLQPPRAALRLSSSQETAAADSLSADVRATAEEAPVARSRQARYVQQSLEAQVRVWDALMPVTEDICRLIMDCVWQPALEVCLEAVLLCAPYQTICEPYGFTGFGVECGSGQ
jgi:hypothetical protein